MSKPTNSFPSSAFEMYYNENYEKVKGTVAAELRGTSVAVLEKWNSLPLGIRDDYEKLYGTFAKNRNQNRESERDRDHDFELQQIRNYMREINDSLKRIESVLDKNRKW